MRETTPGARVGGLCLAALAAAIMTFAFPPKGHAEDRSDARPTPSGRVVTLTELVDRALAAGPDMLISKTNVAMAQAAYTEKAAASSFGVSGNVSATHQGAPYDTRLLALGQSAFAQDTAQAGLALTAPLGTNVGVSAAHTFSEEATPAQTSQISVSASSTLWDGYPGGSALAATRKAALSLQVTLSSEDANRKDIVYQVKQAYYTMLAQQRQLALLQKTLAQRQEELKKTQALFDAHSANQIDLKQAQVNTTQADLDLRLAQGTLEVDRELLSGLVGWPLDTAYDVADAEDLAAPSLDVATAVKNALAQRSDMRQLLLNQGAADIDLALKRGQGTPVVSAGSGLSYTHDWSKTPNTDYVSWNASLKVAAPFYDSGSIDAQIRQAALQKESYDLQQQKLSAGIATDVKNALYALHDKLARAELAEAGLDLARDQYNLARLQFDSGVNSNLDVLTASVALTSAEVSLAKARSDAQLGVLALQHVMGD
jgi:outer membrane protein